MARLRRLLPVLRLVPALLLAVALVRERAAFAALPRLSAVALLAMLAINFAGFLPLRTWRWRIALGPGAPGFRAVYASLLEGLLASIALGFGSGDVVRAARLGGSDRADFTERYGATLAERGAELGAMGLLLSGGAVFAGLGAAALLPGLALAAGYALAVAFGTRILPGLLPRLVRWPRVARGLAAGLAASRPRPALAMVLLSLGGWLCELAILMLCLRAFGLPGDARTALLALVGINVAIAVPGPPANIGTFEAGIVAGLRFAGVPVDRALVFALGYHLIMTVPVALAGTAVFLLRGVSTKNERAKG